MPRLPESIWSSGLLLLICVLSFGLHIPALGFYWDDYASLYMLENQGEQSLKDLFSGQARPIAGQLGVWIWELVDTNPLGWHSINFVLYMISVFVFWRIVRLLWPSYKTQTTLIALLFAVYPSYHLRPIAISFYLSAPLTLFLVSFWLSLIAAQRKNLPLAIGAALLIPLYQMIYEQNIAYEALRPLAMGWILMQNQTVHWQTWRRHLNSLLKYWFPYPIIAGGVLVYRFFIFEPNNTYAEYNQFQVNSIDNLLLIFKRSVVAPVEMVLLDWVKLPYRIFITEQLDADIPGALATIFVIFAIGYFWQHQDGLVQGKKSALGVSFVSMATISVLLLSVHLVGRALQIGFDSRWALSPSPLAALVVGLLVPLAIRPAALAQLFLLALVILGIAVQVGITQTYAQDWELRRELWHQIRWRAPQVQPNTMIVVYLPPQYLAFDRTITDYEVTGHSNLYYAGEQYPYVVGTDDRLVTILLTTGNNREGIWSEVISGANLAFRNWEFDLDNMLLFGYEGGCIHTAEPEMRFQTLPSSPMLLLAPFHDPSQILDIPLEKAPPVDKAVAESPDFGWCYYYQQIQWALQFNHDEQAASLADSAQANGFSPVYGSAIEWLPFIEAYWQVGRYEESIPLIYRVAAVGEEAQHILCKRFESQIAEIPASLTDQMAILCYP